MTLIKGWFIFWIGFLLIFLNWRNQPISAKSRPWENSTRRTHRPDWPAVGSAEGVVQVTVVKTDDELEAFDAVRHVLVKRTRPIGAFVADEARRFIITAIPCRQEDTIAIARGEQTAFHPVDGRPRMTALCQQFDPLVVGWSAPALTPVGGGGIVAWLQGFQVVSEAVEAEIRLTAILSELVVIAIAV